MSNDLISTSNTSEVKNAVRIVEAESRITYLEDLVCELRSLPIPARGETGAKGDTGAAGVAGKDGAPGPVGPKGDPGISGKPGSIAAAVENCERVLDEKLKSLFDRVELYAKRESEYNKESLERFLRELDQFRAEMRQSFSDFQASDKVRLQNLVVEVLAEYAVVSSHDNRVIQAS